MSLAKFWGGMVARPKYTMMMGLGVATLASAMIASASMPHAAMGGARVLTVLLAVFAASTVSSIAGFAFSAICGAMLLRLMPDPVAAVETMMAASIAIQGLSVALLWRRIDWGKLPVFLLGGLMGVPLGIGLLLHLRTAVLREAIGALLTAYAAYALFARPVRIARAGPFADLGIGFLGGITGGLAGFPGAAVTIWCGMQGWDRHRQRGVYQPFILVMQLCSLGLIGLVRIPAATATDWRLPMAAILPALLGTCLGLTVFSRMSDRSFTLGVNILLLVSGLGLLLP